MTIHFRNSLRFIAAFLILLTSVIFISCGDSSTGSTNKSDSVHSGLEGTRDDASQLSNATVDTSSGQNVKKATIPDSSKSSDSVPVK